MRVAAYFALFTIIAVSAGCAWQWHDPAPDLSSDRQEQPWLVHCETAESHLPDDEKAASGVRKARWLWARDVEGKPIELAGQLEDGFLAVKGIRQRDNTVMATSLPALRQICLETLLNRDTKNPLELGKVRAARDDEEIDVPMAFPPVAPPPYPVRRMVIFGDSLSDTGRLKKRLHVFPGEPYWLGRFSNGPNWVDYLAASTGLSMQNHAYGGASVTMHEKMPGEELFARIKQGGQLLVTGSLEQQVDDYINRNLGNGHVQQPDRTVFVIWAGANDYIWKEPFTGAITTFLNSPRGAAGYEPVVDEVVTAMGVQINKLYAAGARRFLIVNLPDLGKSPVVLQNKTYFPPRPPESDAARKIELARRFSRLTAYHNERLQAMTGEISLRLHGAQILQEDAAAMVNKLMNEKTAADYGFDLLQNTVSLEHRNQKTSFQQRCYKGGYLGSSDASAVCEDQQHAFFWDVIHPATLTHCWQSWFIGNKLASEHWIAPVPSQQAYRTWCELVANRQNGHRETAWRLSGL
jgi:thermolabile hemolysin